MRQLERRLGVALFDRTDRRLALTQAGETLAKEAAAVLSALELAVRRTRQAAVAVTNSWSRPNLESPRNCYTESTNASEPNRTPPTCTSS
ncbi:LysR family transcriptional regulator [Actinomadura meridiana]|uniref:LysR family transcriptional regulator n=1 Tax=Actinomadura meridiana TaxID=559626 RepID=UPI003CD079DE